jgi:hypothetical protein
MVCALGALAAALTPAVASAAPAWQRLPDPPGAESITVASDVPTVSYSSPAGVCVAQLAADGNGWRNVGNSIEHERGAAVQGSTVAESPDGDLWVAWTELAERTWQARVARFDGTAWREVVGGKRPINVYIAYDYGPFDSAYRPKLAFFAGTPYVAYQQDGVVFTFRIVRLAANGSAWERIDPSSPGEDVGAHMVVSGGRLYAATTADGPGVRFPRVWRLNAQGTGWDRIAHPVDADYHSVAGLADLGDRPGLLLGSEVTSLGSDDTWSDVGGGPVAEPVDSFVQPFLVALDGVPYVAWSHGESEAYALHVSRLAGGAWSSLPSPGTLGTASGHVVRPQLAEGNSTVYVTWPEQDGARTATHVAALTDSAPQAVDEPGVGSAPCTRAASDDSVGDHGPEEAPRGPLDPTPTPTPTPGSAAAPKPRGHCANEVRGTAFADVLRGTRRGDSIFGREGNDRLFGYAGGDCLFGGQGNDVLRGGSGNDDLNGGPGKDLIHAGPGRDEVGGASGNDRIDVRGGGSDVVACGSGHDVVLVDRSDGTRGCERVIVRR